LGSPHGGGEVKILSLGSPHGGKPPLAPLTDRNKPAVWAATQREAGWIPIIQVEILQLSNSSILVASS